MSSKIQGFKDKLGSALMNTGRPAESSIKNKIGSALMNTGRPSELNVKDNIGSALMNNSRAIDERMANASEKVSKVAAKVKLQMSNSSSKIKSSYLKAKNFTKEKFSALSEKISAIVKVVKDFFSPAVRKANKQMALDKLNLQKSEAEYQNAKNEQILKFQKNAQKFVKAIKGFENSDPETNFYVTAKSKYDSAIETFAKDLASLDGKVSRKELLEIYNKAEKKETTRIFADSRYGSDFEKVNKGISIPRFISIILKSEIQSVKDAYRKEINLIAADFIGILTKIENIQDATKFNHKKSETLNELAEDSEYKNIIGKDQKSIAKDLQAAMVKRLGKGKIEKLISDIKSRIYSPKLFNEGVAADIKESSNKISEQIKSLKKNSSDLYDRFEALTDQILAYAKEKQDLLSQVSILTKEKCDIRRKEVEQDVRRINKEKEDIRAQMRRIAEDTERLEQQRPVIINQLRLAHLSNLNARRRELGKLIGLDLKDITTLPAFPILKEKAPVAPVVTPSRWGAFKTRVGL